MHTGRFAEELDDLGYVETDPTARYARFEEVLGKGAMKTVYKAIDEVLGMEVAWSQIKLNELLQSPEDLERLYSEVHLLSTLNHDSIMRFYTSWIDIERRTFNFITEMFTSGTLRGYRNKYKRVDIGAIKSWARQILEGLVYLHEHDPPVIHRDLKCDNIFVNGHLGQVKIGDLGLAAILLRSHRAHSVIGTPEFMAPEFYDENYNELVDVYSFGMCILEMLTAEYPYSECANPAQIYKKVTSGKKPRAFYKVQDLEAQRFIGKCLEPASNRLSAKQLLLDPFLVLEDFGIESLAAIQHQKPFFNDEIAFGDLYSHEDVPKTNMTIKGTLNPYDNTIFLKVQIVDKQGQVRNVYFPFDTVSDTPSDVANEMTRELDITDWKPSEIANMIDGEISGLVPHWKKWNRFETTASHVVGYKFDNNDHHNHFQSCSSYSSSQVSSPEYLAPQALGANSDGHHYPYPQDETYQDTISQSSSHFSGGENDPETSPGRQSQQLTTVNHHHSRFFPIEKGDSTYKDKYKIDMPCLTRNRSLVDMRSQLLHKTLMLEVNKRRLFKTVGAVENIGFQAPCDEGSSRSHRWGNVTCSMRLAKYCKAQGHNLKATRL